MFEKISILDIIDRIEEYFDVYDEQKSKRLMTLIVILLGLSVLLIALCIVSKITEETSVNEYKMINYSSVLDTDKKFEAIQKGSFSAQLGITDIIGVAAGETIQEYKLIESFEKLYSQAKENEKRSTILAIPAGAGATEFEIVDEIHKLNQKIGIYGWNEITSNCFSEKRSIHIVLIYNDDYIELENDAKLSKSFNFLSLLKWSIKTGRIEG